MTEILRSTHRSVRRRIRRWRSRGSPELAHTPESDRLAFYRSLVAEGALCFDIGANVGNRVQVLLELGARVVAIEPQRACAEELRRRFKDHDGFVLVEKAVGAEPGEAVLHVPRASTIATLSTDFISATQESGRFSEYAWDHEETVEVTTIDLLMAGYGTPEFCKIDIEGFEAVALVGLTRPIKCLSFEFTPELLDVGIACIDRLDTLGDYEYNFSAGESMRWAMDRWVDSARMKEILSVQRYPSWGDVYARTTGSS